jgi:hypothetical protein
MFELNQSAKLTSINARAERHGDDRVPAFDLKFEAAMPNNVLLDFHPELRQMLFKRNDDPDLVEQGEEDALTALRFPKMSPIKWDFEGTGYTLTVGYGIGGPSDITLAECKVDKFTFEPQNGGSVVVRFRAIAHPDSAFVGKLCEKIQQSVELVVMPPEPTTAADLFRAAA